MKVEITISFKVDKETKEISTKIIKKVVNNKEIHTNTRSLSPKSYN